MARPARSSGNLSTATPALFVNAAAGDLHLKPTATALMNKIVTPLANAAVDWDGQARPAGLTDIGADEFQDPAQRSTGSAHRPALSVSERPARIGVPRIAEGRVERRRRQIEHGVVGLAQARHDERIDEATNTAGSQRLWM
jgi:hypothetical protein